MRPRDERRSRDLDAKLRAFDSQRIPLPGIAGKKRRVVFIEQILESIRRVRYPQVLCGRAICERRSEPTGLMFDPLKAAIVQSRQGNIDEAFWLVFLATHFGKHRRGGWRYVREIYGRLGGPGRWDWRSTWTDLGGFKNWLETHQLELRRKDAPGGFGNHRKYESLAAYSPSGTGAVVESYVRWVDPPRTHRRLFDGAIKDANGDGGAAFNNLYESMRVVRRFGRTARFDYLAMIGQLGLAGIKPPSAYMRGATGPLRGARLLFGKKAARPADLDVCLIELDKSLGVGMQVLEDSLCNWQKHPAHFQRFRG